MPAPRPAQIPVQETHHDIVKTDEYSWLRDANWQAVMKNPASLCSDIRAHLEAENAYTLEALESTAQLRDQLFNEMRARVDENEASVPVNVGSKSWNTRYRAGDEHPLICCGPRDCAAEDTEPVLDCNAFAQGHDYFKLINTEVTDDSHVLAWAADFNGSEYLTIQFHDVEAGCAMDDRLTMASSALAWSQDGSYFFYILLDDNHRPYRVMRHKMGSHQADDVCVYEEKDNGFFLSLSKTASNDFIIISAHDHETSESWVIDAQTPETPARCIAPRSLGFQYSIEHDAARDRWIILTNWDHTGRAEDFQIMTAPLETTHTDHWRPLIDHQAGQLILDVNVYTNHLVWLCRINALPIIRISNLSTGNCEDITFSEPAYDLILHGNSEYDSTTVRFNYTSMTTPREVYDFDLLTQGRTLRHQQNVPSGHNPDDYVTARLWAKGHDGASIPVSILHHKDTKIDGQAPILLYGYGAYGITIPASFAISRLSLVDRGFIYAIAHIRGGKACGYNWFKQGRRELKTNTFKDFISAAEMLINRGYTKAGRISMHGGSAGGLLVGAVANMAPQLFCSAVAEVPFVDTLNTMLDETLPLTPPEWPEWGNPILSKDDYQTIANYAPYENIHTQAYPHILATAGLTDPRVTYWEPAKWIARLRGRRSDDGLTLLKTEMQAGHGGPAGRFNQLRETAFVYSFVLACHALKN